MGFFVSPAVSRGLGPLPPLPSHRPPQPGGSPTHPLTLTPKGQSHLQPHFFFFQDQWCFICSHFHRERKSPIGRPGSAMLIAALLVNAIQECVPRPPAHTSLPEQGVNPHLRGAACAPRGPAHPGSYRRPAVLPGVRGWGRSPGQWPDCSCQSQGTPGWTAPVCVFTGWPPPLPLFGPGAGFQGWGRKISAFLSFSEFWPVKTVPSLFEKMIWPPGRAALLLTCW